MQLAPPSGTTDRTKQPFSAQTHTQLCMIGAHVHTISAKTPTLSHKSQQQNKQLCWLCCTAAKWTGATCKVPQEACSNKTSGGLFCMNGGTCQLDADANEFYCKCPPNVRGRHCQFGVKECKDGM
eukprot:GHUV01032126.1.p1 GENE.GHUV01032126.1~~GHUV01032126.1.p1  ORF type:complete len:125 (-),score=21.31 GHUV01032126.1:13-387(-)